MSYTLLDELDTSRQLIVAMLRIDAEDGSARIGAWSLRDVAAHLASTERDCYEPRIRSIAAGENPHFDYFTNDQTDFSGTQLEAAIEEWTETRNRLLDFVRSLSDEQRQLFGVHERYGRVTVDGYLEIALAHDRDHLRGLERLAGQLTR